jgi:uncharacterized damage-inducible protein DinB
MMLTQSLQQLFQRDLNKLKSEIELYNNESAIWTIDKGIANSAGNLCLHLVGNLKHFIGTILGGTDYKRDREAEFSLKNVPRTELVQQVEETLEVISTTLSRISHEELAAEFPIDVFGYKMNTGYFLIHLAMHLDYHLGQINYHRRLLDKMG